jgi:hypothetical protein
VPEYHAVSGLLDMLTNVANAFQSTNSGPQQRELARFSAASTSTSGIPMVFGKPSRK